MEHFIRGTKINVTNALEVNEFIRRCDIKNGGYICLFGLYPLTESFRNRKLQRAFNASLLNPVHGKSIEWYLRLKGYNEVKAVDGVYLLKSLLNEDLTHYFYGTDEETLARIEEKVQSEYPNASVLGYKAPDYFGIDEIEDNEVLLSDFKKMDDLQPQIIWVGLGGIKQDLVMYHYNRYCANSLMIGVGAAFDYFAGTLSLSPGWMKSLGLRWLYRGVIQPRSFRRSLKILKNILYS